jgi:hypothetical protein
MAIQYLLGEEDVLHRKKKKHSLVVIHIFE